MKYTLISFFKQFYGNDFHRHFRRPIDFKNPKSRIQFTVENPKQLYLHVHRNSGNHPCLIHTYNQGSLGNLNNNDVDKVVFDRAFLDFDASNSEATKIKKELQLLRSQGLKNKEYLQHELRDSLQDLIINQKIVKSTIDEVKHFAKEFQKVFGNFPLLFFSGCKGCHAYTFFDPIKPKNINDALYWFGKTVKKGFNYQSMDLSVLQDAMVRLSRVPYSKHQLTGLTVVPFQIEDTYDEIMQKSLNPNIDAFNTEDYVSNFGNHLVKLDQTLTNNVSISEKTNKIPHVELNKSKNVKLVIDHIEWFKGILGEPEFEYPNKNYVMYRCPFRDHNDKKPSFRVHINGYYCYGCQKRGNYWQFLKDYNNWTDVDVKQYLKKH